MSWFTALLRRYAHTEVFRRVMPHLAGSTDRIFHRVSGGRWRPSEAVMPLLILHHTGRTSGRTHATPLFHVRTEHGWVVVASNFGRDSHPAWSENLLSDPAARIEVDGRTVDVHARLASEDERSAVWPEFVRSWPAYDAYVQAASHRRTRVFVLEPRAPTAG